MLSIIGMHAGLVSSFSVPPSSNRVPSSFPLGVASISYAHSDNAVAATQSNGLFARRAAALKLRRPSQILPVVFRFICVMKKSISRSFAILSLTFLVAVSNSRPAFAWGKTAEAQITKAEAPAGVNKKCVKFVVTAGAVVAGAASANKVRGLSLNTSDDETEEVPLIEVKTEQPRLVEEPPNEKPISYPTVSNAPLIKDLDAKIDRLREQERLAVEHAKENMARAAAEKAEQMARAAAESEKNRVKEQIRKIAEEETNKIEQQIADVEKERKEKMERVEEESQVNQMENGREMKHKVTQSSHPPLDDESSSLIETGAAGRMEKDRLLSEKYAPMTEEERALKLLLDHGMVMFHKHE